MADLRRTIGLKMREWLWRIYCLTAMNGPLPAELKFRENAVYVPNYNFCPLREKNMMVVRQMFGAVVLFCMLC